MTTSKTAVRLINQISEKLEAEGLNRAQIIVMVNDMEGSTSMEIKSITDPNAYETPRHKTMLTTRGNVLERAAAAELATAIDISEIGPDKSEMLHGLVTIFLGAYRDWGISNLQVKYKDRFGVIIHILSPEDTAVSVQGILMSHFK